MDDYDVIRKKLDKMTELAAERRKAGKYCFEVNDGKKRYIRINSSKFRAVSLDADNPCGHLLYSHNNKAIGIKILKSALFDAKNSDNENHKPGNKKPEHQVQAYIIWQALKENGPKELPAELGIADHFNALWFVTDEISLSSIRADVVMLGEYKEEGKETYYAPVFVELKNGRTTSVADQLKNAKKITSEVNHEFRKFLTAATGKPCEAIRMEKIKLLVIWGTTSKERPEAQKMRQEYDVLTVCHSEKKDEPGTFEFKLHS